MKDTGSRLPQDTLHAHLEAAFPLDPRRLTVFAALILVLIEQRTVCLARLVTRIRLPGTGETVYQRLKRFVRFDWTTQQTQTARFILQHFQQELEVLLVMDRTNWAWGKQPLNLLVVSILWRSFSFPLAWTVLPHGGSSDMQRRIQLVETVMPLLTGNKVLLLADREFIGRDWFQALKRLGVQPTIRLLATTRVGGVPVWACFKKLRPDELRIWHRAVDVYGVQMRVLACKNHAGETLYLAYHGVGHKAITRYAWRWNVENMHQSMKGRGFDLEATRLTQGARLSVLFGVVVLAFVWCCLSGDFLARKSPPKKLKHGYPAKSLFRMGLDALQDALSSRPNKKVRTGTSFKQLLTTFDP